MKLLQVLERFVEDWAEIYGNGELIWEGPRSVYDYQLVTSFLDYISDKASTVISRRRIVVEYNEEDPENMPVHRITGENYFDDWNKAEKMES